MCAEVKRTLIECGCCGEYHENIPPCGDYRDDCRYDTNRYACLDDFCERRGVSPDQVKVIDLEEEE